jgi:hypothetical protein
MFRKVNKSNIPPFEKAVNQTYPCLKVLHILQVVVIIGVLHQYDPIVTIISHYNSFTSSIRVYEGKSIVSAIGDITLQAGGVTQ